MRNNRFLYVSKFYSLVNSLQRVLKDNKLYILDSQTRYIYIEVVGLGAKKSNDKTLNLFPNITDLLTVCIYIHFQSYNFSYLLAWIFSLNKDTIRNNIINNPIIITVSKPSIMHKCIPLYSELYSKRKYYCIN